MEIIEALRYVEIVFLLCTLLFILFTWLPVSRHVLGVPRTDVYYNRNLATPVAFLVLAFSVNLEKRHGAVYSMTLQTTLLMHALTSFLPSQRDVIQAMPTDLPNMPNPHKESAGEGAPEKKLTMFAMTMSILDLMARGLAFLKCSLGVWKTQGVMVKLITVLTSILEVIQIISCRCGVELHHMHNMQELSHLTHSLSCIFYWFHLISVLASGSVSVVGLASHDFGKKKEALIFFYAVAILEALVFLAEEAFWEWKVRWYKLLENAKDECGFETSEIIKRFVYDVYYKCMTGNIFDVPKMNLVTFAEELLVSTSDKEQFMGIRILLKILNHKGLSNATLGKILTSKDSKVIARLIQMLNLNNFFKEEIRSLAAEIVIMFLDDEEPMMQHMVGMKEAIKSAKLLRKETAELYSDLHSKTRWIIQQFQSSPARLFSSLTRTERSAESGRPDRGESTGQFFPRSERDMVVHEDLHDSANDHFTWKNCLSPRLLYLQLTSFNWQQYPFISEQLESAAIILAMVLLLLSYFLKGYVLTWQMKCLLLFSELLIFLHFIRVLYHRRPMHKVSSSMEVFSHYIISIFRHMQPITSEEHEEKAHKATWNLAFNALHVMALTNAVLHLALKAFYVHLNRVANDDADIDQSSIPISHQDSMGEGVSEKNLIKFVIRIGILDLTASGLGLLKYSLAPWKSLEAMVKFITVLTFIFEGIRIYCRSRGFELHHMHNIKQLSLLIRFTSWLFYWLHLIFVLASGVLSFLELVSLNFGKTEEALVFFYVMALLEALVFLAKKAFWDWKVSFRRLFKEVKCYHRLDTTDMDFIRRFIYNAYYKCVTGYISDVSKMDLVTFAEELIFSTSGEEQLMGARILMKLSTHQVLSDDTLCKIGTSKDVISRLIQMLNLVNYFEENIRSSAAHIISELAKKEPKLKDHVVGMEQAIETANSLLNIN